MNITGTNKQCFWLKLNFIEENECGGNVSNGNCKDNIEPFSVF